MDKRSLIFVILLSISFFLMQYWFPAKPITTQPEKKVAVEAPKTSTPIIQDVTKKEPSNEEFYVIENDYFQIVFSTIGGAITEINFPFHTKENTKSLVNPIRTDKAIREKSPNNDYFPCVPYYSIEEDSPTFHKMGKLGGYHPLLRRPIFNENGQIINDFPSEYYLCNFVDNNTHVEQLKYKVIHFNKNSISFSGRYNNQNIIKTYSLSKSHDETIPYCIDLSIETTGENNPLWISSGVLEVDPMPGQTTTLKYRYKKVKKYDVAKIKLPKSAQANDTICPDWVSNSNGFFGVILNPKDEIFKGFRSKHISGKTLPTRLSLIDPQYNLYDPLKYPGYELFLPLAIKDGKAQYKLYLGPFQNKTLKVASQAFSDPVSGYTPDYLAAKSSQGFFSFISAPFSKLLFILMSFFHAITHSWGFSIILLTIALRIMLYPLNSWSIKSNLKMQEIAPHVKEIQARYKKDPKKAQSELMKYYREMGANPLTGCFPLLIQMPFLFGMFDLLRTTFDLRGVSFIPGWITNLSAPDVLFSWNYPIIFFGNEFHLLPFLLGIITFLQQKMTMTLPKNKADLTDQQKQQKMMMYLMPVIFIFITYNLASGLNIYWLCSTLLGILQQVLMSYKKKKIKRIKEC